MGGNFDPFASAGEEQSDVLYDGGDGDEEAEEEGEEEAAVEANYEDGSADELSARVQNIVAEADRRKRQTRISDGASKAEVSCDGS